MAFYFLDGRPDGSKLGLSKTFKIHCPVNKVITKTWLIQVEMDVLKINPSHGRDKGVNRPSVKD